MLVVVMIRRVDVATWNVQCFGCISGVMRKRKGKLSLTTNTDRLKGQPYQQPVCKWNYGWLYIQLKKKNNSSCI